MSFNDRINSVARELNGKGQSTLHSETGRTAKQWRNFVNMLTKQMWGFERLNVISDFAYASAVYEWAAINWRDRYFDTTRGSFGSFQGYRAEIINAFNRNPELIKFLIGLKKRGAAQINKDGIGDVKIKRATACGLSKIDFERPLSEGESFYEWMAESYRIHGSQGLNALQKNRCPTGMNSVVEMVKEIEDFESTLYNPYINLIGKIQLSLHKAQRARGAPPNKTKWPIWFLPDEALCWVLFCYEGAGEEAYAPT